jgi:hypothetical protein
MNALRWLLILAYPLGGLATFVKLTFFDCFAYTWWNWLLAVPLNVLISSGWPVYWLIRPLLSHAGCA